MSEKKPQTYANHRRFVPFYHFVLTPIFLIYFVHATYHLARPLWTDQPFSWSAVVGFLFAFGMLGLFLYARTFALKAQDRTICLEMRLRLHEVLPEDLRARIGELKPRQLVGLRFAGDGEIADLVKAALDENLSGEQLKKRIKDWQPDYLRV